MRKTKIWGFGLILALLLSVFSAPVAMAGDDELEAKLTGAQEIPGPGDPDGKGKIEVEIKRNFTRLCYELKVSRIDPATAAHIHRGVVGVAGPVVVGLTAPTNGKSKGCITIDPVLGREIATTPEQFYANVHNVAYPSGAIRGQLEED